MCDKLAYWGSYALSFLALLLVIAGIALHSKNVALQAEIAQRGQQLNAGQSFAQLYNGLAQNLANLAVAKNDEAIRGLLEAEGLKLAPPPEAGAADKTAPAKQGAAKNGK